MHACMHACSCELGPYQKAQLRWREPPPSQPPFRPRPCRWLTLALSTSRRRRSWPSPAPHRTPRSAWVCALHGRRARTLSTSGFPSAQHRARLDTHWLCPSCFTSNEAGWRKSLQRPIVRIHTWIPFLQKFAARPQLGSFLNLDDSLHESCMKEEQRAIHPASS